MANINLKDRSLGGLRSSRVPKLAKVAAIELLLVLQQFLNLLRRHTVSPLSHCVTNDITHVMAHHILVLLCVVKRSLLKRILQKWVQLLV